MFYDVFKQLCDAKGISCNKAALEIGLSNATPTKWKKTGAVPSGETLQRIADYFQVSVNFLLEKPERNPFMANALTENDAPAPDPLQDNDVLFALFGGSDNITPEMIEDVKRFARYVKQEKEKQKK